MSTLKSPSGHQTQADPELKSVELPLRLRLPDTRRSVTHKFRIGESNGYIIVGLFEDGRPGELFLKIANQGSAISGLANAVGVLTSLALQHGVPVDTLARKFEFVRFEPSGWTQNEEIRFAHSIVDYVFRWLGQTFSQVYRDEKAVAINHSKEMAKAGGSRRNATDDQGTS